MFLVPLTIDRRPKMFEFAVILIHLVTVSTAFNFLKQPCIVDSAFHDRFDQSRLIFTVMDKFYEINMTTATMVRSGFIKEYWANVTENDAPIEIATSLPGKVYFSKKQTLYGFNCTGSIYNCKHRRYRHRPPYGKHIPVAGLYYQAGMPVYIEGGFRAAYSGNNSRYATFEAIGHDFIQCGPKNRTGQSALFGCDLYEDTKLGYQSFELARGDRFKYPMTAISVAWFNDTQTADFVVFIPGFMRYTINGAFKYQNLHNYLSCPLSVFKLLVFLLIVVIALVIVVVAFWIYLQKTREAELHEHGTTITVNTKAR